MIKRTKAQEEIIGFVIIVVIVVVVGVVLLGISLRRNVEVSNSPEIENFLEASMLTTTECAINYMPQYEDLQGLIKTCYKGDMCLDGKNSCQVLNTTISRIMESAFPLGGTMYKGYRILLYYSTNASESRNTFYDLDRLGNCTGIGAEKFIPQDPGNIIVELEVCVGD